MSKSNTLWWIVLVAWMGVATFWHVCKIKGLCPAWLEEETTQVLVPLEPLQIQDGDRFSVTAPGNFSFPESGAVSDLSGVQPALDSLAHYLRLNPVLRLTIVGQYSATESNSGSYPDLGIARAEGVRQYLIKQNVADSILTVGSQLLDNPVFQNDSLRGGVVFSFSKVVPSTEEGLAQAQLYESIDRPMDLYFSPTDANYIKTPYNEKFIEEARLFLSENTDRSISLIGYTDNEGVDSLNVNASLMQAEKVKRALVEAGFAPGQIRVEGRGAANPKETNDTPEGKRANRRVSLVIQR